MLHGHLLAQHLFVSMQRGGLQPQRHLQSGPFRNSTQAEPSCNTIIRKGNVWASWHADWVGDVPCAHAHVAYPLESLLAPRCAALQIVGAASFSPPLQVAFLHFVVVDVHAPALCWHGTGLCARRRLRRCQACACNGSQRKCGHQQASGASHRVPLHIFNAAAAAPAASASCEGKGKGKGRKAVRGAAGGSLPMARPLGQRLNGAPLHQ